MNDFPKGNASPAIRVDFDRSAFDAWCKKHKHPGGIDGSGTQMQPYTYAQWVAAFGKYGDPLNYLMVALVESSAGFNQLPSRTVNKVRIYDDPNNPSTARGIFQGRAKYGWPGVISPRLIDHVPMAAYMASQGVSGYSNTVFRARVALHQPAAGGPDVGSRNCAFTMYYGKSAAAGKDLQDASLLVLEDGSVITGWSPLGVARKFGAAGAAFGLQVGLTSTRWTVAVNGEELPIPADTSALKLLDINIDRAEFSKLLSSKPTSDAVSAGPRVFLCTAAGRAAAIAHIKALYAQKYGAAPPVPFPITAASTIDSVNGVITTERASVLAPADLEWMLPLAPPPDAQPATPAHDDRRVFTPLDRRFSVVQTAAPSAGTTFAATAFTLADDFTEPVIRAFPTASREVWIGAITAGLEGLADPTVVTGEFARLFERYSKAGSADMSIRLRPTPHIRYLLQRRVMDSNKRPSLKANLLALLSALPSSALVPANAGDLAMAYVGMALARNVDGLAHRLPMCAVYKNESSFMLFHASTMVPVVLPVIPMDGVMRKRDFTADFFMKVAVEIEPSIHSLGRQLETAVSISPAMALAIQASGKAVIEQSSILRGSAATAEDLLDTVYPRA